LVPGSGLLLTGGSTYDSARGVSTGIGVRAYAPNGDRRYHILGDSPVWSVQVAGTRAIVALAPGHALVDLRSGRILRRSRQEPPFLLTRETTAF
jgi:hypothetical protein